MSEEVSTTGLVAGTWNVDQSHSEVAFSVRHLMSKVRGNFTDFVAEITTTDNPVDSKVSATIQVPSISTNNEQRDGHLKSADFFDPAAGQEIVFVSTAIKEDDDSYVITGDLTLNGVTKVVDLAADFLGVAVDGYGLTRLGVEASTTISRKEYNIDFNVPLDGDKLMIGDKVTITLTIEAVKA